MLLDKLRLQTRAKEEEESLARGGKDPFIVVKNPSASKGGVAETSIKVSTGCFSKIVRSLYWVLMAISLHILACNAYAIFFGM